MFVLKEATSKLDFEIGIQLFKEYVAYIAIDLGFQNFDEELRTIQNQYSRPIGVLIIAHDSEGEPVGCTGVRKLEDGICELKRMYIVESCRGAGLGKQLMLKAIEFAKELNYSKMRLDTLETMTPAISLYESVGFYDIEPYRHNPLKGAKYMEAIL